MQTRSPENISPPIVPEFLWKVEGGAAHPNDIPVDAALPLQAFRGRSDGHMEIAIGTDPSDDPVWEQEPSTGGIRLQT